MRHIQAQPLSFGNARIGSTVCMLKKYFKVNKTMRRSYPGVVVRTSHSQSGSNPLAAVSVIPRCYSSLSCINEYLAPRCGGYVNE